MMSFLNDKYLSRKSRNTDSEEDEFVKQAKKTKISEIRKMSVLEIIEIVIKLTEDKPLSVDGAPSKFLKVLAERLEMTPIQALMLSIFVNKCDDNSISFRDLANHFDGNNISILKCNDDIEQLVSRRIIRRSGDHRGRPCYCIPAKNVDYICKNTLPPIPKSNGLEAFEWLEAVEDLMGDVRHGIVDDDEFEARITELIDNNLQLNCVQAIKKHNIDPEDIKLFMAISLRAINFNDDRIERSDLEDYYKRAELMNITRDLEEGDHILFAENMIEHVNNHGMADPSVWKLTDHSKYEIFNEFRFRKPKNENSEVISPDKIAEKKLYYNDEITSQIDELRQLLEKDSMNTVLDRLQAKGMRRGFACLFYGSPGTGKTETVLQLAKSTGRAIMQVNIASMRSMWVGETEKNIKHCFDRYRAFVKNNDTAPILFFNEADALFTKRNENPGHSVDKMENTMANIILQEMENLEGILIATTNLQNSLDDAFERRFLYKIEFTKPSPSERSHIWKTMMPELSHDNAMMLAERFDFSGGQIENIARKHVINDILSNRDEIDIDAIVESCRHESLDKEENTYKIGFVA